MAGGKREGAGRPRGRSPLTKARATLLGHSDAIIDALMAKVEEGDTAAIKVAVERIIPVLKEATPTIEGDTQIERYQSIMGLVADGEIAPNRGLELIALLNKSQSQISNEKFYPTDSVL